ncbi:hypothetical protein PUNSTDRAFT_58853 [Punctularia strigosozonata HHB-11173 SS5]|uniref:uncharacterized protein n=1 Tax=Punctularia strigosozonata (strain HHB-11173) TaxID=741275 RepID=UPI0004417AD0|nr:uncharacterized protein PUNSTDRAFT_58853 [Punctularia strigosozonata HHB-11173 SS5]EIN14620.1 hypothetical protein PUNSTDRAFT_58853 [Punctularia strigosozonata HHB-11173 SS5]
MTKHSKNNTASSIFSYAEYKKLDYGTKRQRLGNESMRRFDCCALCLQRAREPVACQEGHLFCKECVYTDLLSQKKDIKRQKDKLDALRKEAEEQKLRAREAARERVLQDFERGQLGLGARNEVHTQGKDEGEIAARLWCAGGTKRKLPFEFDATKVESLAREAEEAALKQLEKEQAESLRAKLPDFWLPSLTPTYTSAGPPSSFQDLKVQTTCRGGNPPHSIALKNLFPVKFSYPSSGVGKTTPLEDGETAELTKAAASKQDDEMPFCLSCKKTLSNNIILYVMKPCGHVVCRTCTDTLVKPNAQCTVCDIPIKASDIVELRREGTGYAGGGLAETSKAGVAFQG